MAIQQSRCVHDRPTTAQRCRKMGRKPHETGRCGVRGWFGLSEACRMRRNDATSTLGSRLSGESRFNALAGLTPEQLARTGTANVWASMSVDPDAGILYLP